MNPPRAFPYRPKEDAPMRDWSRLWTRLRVSMSTRGQPRPKKPPRGKAGGGEPVPADPKPRPTLLTGGAEAPLDEA